MALFPGQRELRPARRTGTPEPCAQALEFPGMPQAPPALHLPGDPVIIRHPGQAGRRPAGAVVYDMGKPPGLSDSPFPGAIFPKPFWGILARRTQDSHHRPLSAGHFPAPWKPHHSHAAVLPRPRPFRAAGQGSALLLLSGHPRLSIPDILSFPDIPASNPGPAAKAFPAQKQAASLLPVRG